MLSKTTRVYSEFVEHHGLVLRGVLLCIDPSIGSNSSMPGWAVYDAGLLIESGTIAINPSGSVPERLQVLNRKMRGLISQWDPDILIYEEIPAQRYGGGNANAHASLLKALGATLAVAGPRAWLGLHPLTWKRLARSSYVKSDEADAIELGYVALIISRWFSEQAPKAKKKKTNKASKK